MDNLSSGGNFVAGRRPGGLSRWRPKSHLESQLLLNSNLKTVVGAAKINPSLGRIFVDSETNNAYLLTTDGNPAQCNKMVDKQTNASVGGKIKQVPGFDAGATLLQGNELSRQLGFIDNKHPTKPRTSESWYKDEMERIQQQATWRLMSKGVFTKTSYMMAEKSPANTIVKQERLCLTDLVGRKRHEIISGELVVIVWKVGKVFVNDTGRQMQRGQAGR